MQVDRLYQESRGEAWWVRLLLPVLALVWLFELAAPISQVLRSGAEPLSVAPALVGTGLFVAVYVWVIVDAVQVRSGALEPSADARWRWLPSVLMAVLATSVAAVYGPAWLGLFIFASVGSALRLPTRDAAWTIIVLTLVAGGLGLAKGEGLSDLAQGGLLIGGIGASVATVGYTIRLTRELRAARAEVARLAVGEERLRFARDLHDLLGHSLGLVALKCDLADQLVDAAPARVRQEIQQAASVTREALREVRETVAGYRRPTLAGELAGAQELLAAAGIGARVEGQVLELPREAEGALAWALREGVTNVIRHSRARRCLIRLHQAVDRVELEILDDGTALPSVSTVGGNGLRGLAERLAAVGGACQAEPQGSGGFRLSAWVPLVRAPA